VLDRLPEKKRAVFVLHELEGLAPAEIAEIVDAPVLTVRTRLFYARKELCELMRDEPSLVHLASLMAVPRTSTQGRAMTPASPSEGEGTSDEGGTP
jgi:RNA polymerase sigma-70 factor (ECF subfamily)